MVASHLDGLASFLVEKVSICTLFLSPPSSSPLLFSLSFGQAGHHDDVMIGQVILVLPNHQHKLSH